MFILSIQNKRNVCQQRTSNKDYLACKKIENHKEENIAATIEMASAKIEANIQDIWENGLKPILNDRRLGIRPNTYRYTTAKDAVEKYERQMPFFYGKCVEYLEELTKGAALMVKPNAQ